ncbi:MAG: hypothetical protein BGO01_04260 [Armatimonadetes bacterium 55-13]|nr:MAG: hypothetical protein BGO01_04260 [Armatimonadetes bacterium 55-13]
MEYGLCISLAIRRVSSDGGFEDMNHNRWTLACAILFLAGLVVAQSNTQSQSNSQSQNGRSSASSSSSARSSSSNSASAGNMMNRLFGGGANGMSFGFDGRPTHAILYSLTGRAADSNKAFQSHTNYLGELQSKGKVLLFGPWRDLPGSMALVLAQSDDEANNIAKNDPAVSSGALTYEVRAWTVMAPQGKPGSGSQSSQQSGSSQSSQQSSGSNSGGG